MFRRGHQQYIDIYYSESTHKIHTLNSTYFNHITVLCKLFLKGLLYYLLCSAPYDTNFMLRTCCELKTFKHQIQRGSIFILFEWHASHNSIMGYLGT